MMPKGSLLRDRTFVKFWSGQAVSLTGSAMIPVVMPLIAAIALHASGLEASAVSAASLLPGMLFMLPIGAIIEDLPKRLVMMWADLAESAALVVVPVLWWADLLSIPALCAVGFLASTFGIVSQVANQALTPYLVRKDQLIEANAKLTLAESTATSAGPAAAGFLVARLGGPAALGIAAIGSFFSAATLAVIRPQEPPPERSGPERNLYRSILAGLHFIKGNAVLRTLMAINAVDNFFLAWIQAILTVYLLRSLHWDSEAIGLVLGIAALGGVIGSLCAKRLHDLLGTSRLLLLAVSAGAPTEAVVLLLEPGSAGKVIACAAQSVAIFFTVCYSVTSRTLRQIESPDNMRTRITAAHRWVSVALLPVGALLGGLTSSALGLYGAIACGCAGLVVAPALAWVSPLRHAENASSPQVVKTS
ncbi:MFS transporter [Streptomyces sp. ISL-86]|uniref:MFS transporter n=1 Tax=Streptomyces sp. ISL-86 TaxID=2819187 RepID=UPI001BEB363F|nr:MFS transporter [Streptomyces sp. ISL-86]MBT2458187.1 MFS transporter [Streptomyces sp. ISL-86]